MKVWITKYALTAGIETSEWPQSSDGSNFMWLQDGRMVHKKYVFHDRGNAVANAESIRLEKIKSLEKQIAKLKALNFKEVSDEKVQG